MYSYLNIEIIWTICEDKLSVSINHEEDDQQSRQCLDLPRELVSAGRDRGSGQDRTGIKLSGQFRFVT